MHWKPKPDLYPPFLRSRIRRGRGVGAGKSYIPWLKVRDVPSRGTSSIVLGIKSGRAHHLLSELEAIYFYLMERRPTTVDILEQWPILDLDSTLELARKYDVRHPYRKSFPEPFTIDFIICERHGSELLSRASSVKSPEDAQNPDVRRRLAVEHAWCVQKDLSWSLVKTSAFNKELLSNLRFLRSWFRHRHQPNPNVSERFSDAFSSCYERNVPLTELLLRVSKRLRLTSDRAEDLFRYCGWSGHLPIDLLSPLSLDGPVIFLEGRS